MIVKELVKESVIAYVVASDVGNDCRRDCGSSVILTDPLYDGKAICDKMRLLVYYY